MSIKTKDLLIITVATFVLGLTFNGVLAPLSIVIGGSSGISIIANSLFGIPRSVVVFGCHIAIITVGYVFLSKDRISKSLYGSFTVPLFIHLTSPLNDYIRSLQLTSNETLVLVIMGGLISGIAHGLVYKVGYTTGGSDIISQIINKYFGMTVGTANLIINSIIVIVGGGIFGWANAMYAVLMLYIIGIATDKVLLGMSYSKAFYIMTNKVDKVKSYIHNDLGKSVTELDATGGYTNSGTQMLMCVVSTKEYFKLRQGINNIDDDAFFVIMDAYELDNRI